MTPPPVPPIRWRAVPGNELLWARFEDAVVLFHAPSGQTHLVNDATAVLLCEVLAHPQALDEAASKLAAAQDSEADEQFLGEVGRLIHRLETLGLVERVPA